MNVQPSRCLDVVVYMLNCVFWRHILLEIEFKSRVDMGSESQIAFGYCTAVSPMSGSPTFDTGKKNRNGANLKLRHTLRVGGVIILCFIINNSPSVIYLLPIVLVSFE